MTLIFDKELFNNFRKIAITDAAELSVGQTYYSNGHSKGFTVSSIMSNATFEKYHGREYLGSNPGDAGWIIAEGGREISLKDSNIGASYNPWLIFSDEQTAKWCKNQLIVKFGNPRNYDPFWFTVPRSAYSNP